MKIIVCKDSQSIAKTAYQYFKEQLQQKPDSILGLATGSSPIHLYKEMVLGYKQKEVSFKQVKTFNLDEYVGMDHQDSHSYITFMKEHLFNHVDIDLSHVQIPNGKASDLSKECLRYDMLLKQHQVDIQLLGIGSNGHIGFNEPGTPFDLMTHVVELNEQTRKDNASFFSSLEQVPTHALTMGIASILKAKRIILIAEGERKAHAIMQMIKGKITTDYPASILQTHPYVTVIVDTSAASLLNDE